MWNYTGKLGSKRLAEIYITVKSNFSVTPNSWSAIGYKFPFKCKIIQAYTIPCSASTTVQNYHSEMSNKVRIAAYTDDLRIQLASVSTESAQTFAKGDVIYIKIIEL